jgi:hypothetical protein
MIWHTAVLRLLSESSLFAEVQLAGAKVRASVNATQFLDVHFDPTSKSYSYALIDLSLPYEGDKRLFGWDDYPHIGDEAFAKLASYPHHFQERAPDGKWIFSESKFRGEIEDDVVAVIDYLRDHLKRDEK